MRSILRATLAACFILLASLASQAQQTDPNTWLGEKPLTVNVQAQVGVSIFLPFSWEYRLPK